MNYSWDLSFGNGRRGGGVIIPLTPVANSFVWYDASVTSVGAVASWVDLSGNGYNATEAILRPTCTANQLNGKNTLLFNGTSLLNLPAGTFTLPNGDNTCFVVSKRNTETALAEYDWSFTETLSVRHYSRFSATTGNNLFLSNTAATGGVSISGSTNTGYLIKSMFKSGTTLSIQINNGTPTTNTNGANESGIDAGTIGSLGVGGFLTGGIAEIIFYNRLLNSAEILQNNQYLSAKWGITIA